MSEQHCDYEAFCRFFFHDSKIAYLYGTRCMRNHDGCAKCFYDSRTHSAPSTECHGFTIDAVLRAEVIETLRKAGCPCLAEQVRDETTPNYHWCSDVSNTPKQAETMTDQQKYLIDDAMLLQWRAGCIRAAPINPDCDGCEFDNETRGGCDFDDDEMQKIFQSRPYNGVTLYTAGMVANRVAHAKKEVLNEVIKIVMAYERKPKYDYEATLCSVIVESLESLRTTKEGQ